MSLPEIGFSFFTQPDLRMNLPLSSRLIQLLRKVVKGNSFRLHLPEREDDDRNDVLKDRDTWDCPGRRVLWDNTRVMSRLRRTTTLALGVANVADVVGGESNIYQKTDGSGSRLVIEEKGKRTPVVTDRLPPPRNSWDVPLAAGLSWRVQTASGKRVNVGFLILSRPSQLLASVVMGPTATAIKYWLLSVAGVFLLVEIVSLVSSLSLTRTITSSVHDLYQGTVYVGAGDFTRQIPVRGKHQLSDLAASFNGMTNAIRHYVGEMRKKEKLESELEIAREVQARLFPRAVPQLKTLEMAGVCLPGRFVSGDYYDFVRLDQRFTAIALGDVSGKGVSAALLMACIQSALHGQLKFSGAAPNPSRSTATLMALISQQLYESTPPEKYATFFCSVYDDEAAVLRYTNCGHLKPILVRAGQVSALDGDGVVVGLLPNVSYEQKEFELRKSDLLAIFSDGIPEAENAAEEEYGEGRLGALLVRHAGETLEKIIDLVLTDVRAWVHDPVGRDDTTLVLLRRL